MSFYFLGTWRRNGCEKQTQLLLHLNPLNMYIVQVTQLNITQSSYAHWTKMSGHLCSQFSQAAKKTNIVLKPKTYHWYWKLQNITKKILESLQSWSVTVKIAEQLQLNHIYCTQLSNLIICTFVINFTTPLICTLYR